MIAIQVTAHGVVIAVLTVFGAVARPVVAVLPVDGKEMRVMKMYSYKPTQRILHLCLALIIVLSVAICTAAPALAAPTKDMMVTDDGELLGN